VRPYDPAEIEPKWRARWEAEELYRAGGPDDPRPRFYALDMFPYPSGDLHMGHAEAFAIGDAVARYAWMRGFDVLHPIGWDAFGLPAENAAIKRGIHPKEWTYANIEQQRDSFKAYGISFDWTRQFNTCDPEYYRWTQWLFLQLHARGLAYRKQAPANWCPNDRTVLANEQVIGGRCERCGTVVVRKDLTQWFFRITDYAERLLDDMRDLEGAWPERVLTMQRNWIGRSEGAEVDFEVAGETVTVFTTRPDTLWGVTFFVFAPEHPLVARLAHGSGVADEVAAMVEAARSTPLAEREEAAAVAASKEGIRLGVDAVNPVNGERAPCFVAPYVLMEYGTGAVMGVPAHDQRDFEFARAHGLPIRVVVEPPGERRDPETMTEAYDHEGGMVNSGPLDGTPSPEGIPTVIAWLEERGAGRKAVQYRLRDWLISRQRYWGCPIPIVHCPEHGEVPIPDSDLPVLLPDDVDFAPHGDSPLAMHEGFVNTTCPIGGEPARRETDTMDTFVESSWYFLRYCSPRYDGGMFERAAAEYWMPVDQYIGGIEHAVLHLLYARFYTKVLRDLGLVKVDEPFLALLSQGMVIKDGAKMSKSKGNVVDPDDLIRAFGADTARLFSLFAAPPEKDLDWNDHGVEGASRFLNRIWRFVVGHAEELRSAPPAASGGLSDDARAFRRTIHETINRVTTDIENEFHFNTAISAVMELVNALHAFDTASQDRVPLAERRALLREAVDTLLLLLGPFCPHLTEELWQLLGHAESLFGEPWPQPEIAALTREEVTVVVQVDGKVRSRLTVGVGTEEGHVKALALADDRVQPWLAGRRVARVVVVPGRLVNVVTSAS